MNTRAEAIIAADRDGIIRFWNPGAERIFGHSADTAIGRSLDIIIPERLRDEHWQGYRATMETGRSRYGEGDLLAVPALHQNGTTVSIEFTVLPLKDSAGAIVAIAAFMREIRTLKRKLADAGKTPE